MLRTAFRTLFLAILSLLPVRALAEDRDVAESARTYEYFANSWGLVGLKDYRDGTRIGPDGTLFLGEGAKCQFLVGEAYAPLPTDIIRSLEKDSVQLSGLFRPQADVAAFDVALPVVNLNWATEHLSYEFIIFASPLNPADASSYGHPPASENYLNQICVRVQSESLETTSAPVGISISRPFSAPEELAQPGEITRYASRDEGRLVVLFGVPKGSSVEKVGASIRWKVPLTGKGSSELFAVLSHVPLGKGESLPEVPLPLRRSDDAKKTVEPGTASYSAEVLRRTKEFWRDLLRRGAIVGVPEEKPSLTYYASLIYTFIGRDGTVIKPGEGFYDEFYLRDGAYQTHALDLAGFASEAKESLAHFLKYQRPDGQFVSQEGELDGNGQALWALWSHYALTGDIVWLEEVYPAATKAVSWLERARQSKVPLDSPYFGILFASIADGENLMQTPKHIVGYDFWNLRGVDCAARMAKAIGKTSDADEYRQLFMKYKDCVENALKKARADWFPPTYEGVGTSWGNLEVVHPTALFDPGDPRVTATLDRVRAGFVEGTIRWGEEEKKVIHPYMGTFVTNSEIMRGEREKAVDHFYHYLAHTTSTHGFPEGVYYETRAAWGDTVPHLWAAAQYIILLRNMLLREEGEVLHLLPAVPVAWLRPGKKIVALSAPTNFGKVSLAVSATEEECEVRFSWPDRTPKEVLLHIPPGATVKRAVWREKSETPVQKNAIAIPKGCERLRIEWTLPPEETDRTFDDYAREYTKHRPSP
jgi:hypothetical protein